VKVLITGANGLVGRALTNRCLDNDDLVSAMTHQDLDISSETQVESIISRVRPDVVINCAAWTDVDGCESDVEKAHRINAEGVAHLARASRNVDALFITISTDYVFDGAKTGFYTQRDNPDPQSVYAESKLAGERLAQRAHTRTIVVRTGYIFGPGGTNFLSQAVSLARSGKKLKAIYDCVGTPTYSIHLANQLRELAVLDIPGLFHVVNSGDGASFEQFVREALRVAEISDDCLERVSVKSLNRPAARPENSRLKCLLSESIGLRPMPGWDEALQEFVEQM
jgi:dTDP-4-dehydrorhamnose reductase